jgi:uncharacterized protein YjbJ (UPF0337 family)
MAQSRVNRAMEVGRRSDAGERQLQDAFEDAKDKAEDALEDVKDKIDRK